MPAIDFSTIKRKLVNIKSTSFFKVAAGVLFLAPLLTISVITHHGPATDQPKETLTDESLCFKPPVSGSVPSGSTMAYIKPDKVAGVGNLLSFTILAADAEGDTLVYSASGLPDGATFDTETHTFSWTPRYDQAGVYTVHFEVSDGEFTDSEDVVITVAQLYNDWDVNGDSVTNILDMILVGQHWGETGLTGWILEDTNEDGSINVLDIIVVGQHWTG